jgi:hypothetical protein
MKWTEERVRRVIELKSKGLTNRNIASKLKTSENSIKMKLSKLAKKGKIKLKERIHDDNFTFKGVSKDMLVKGLLLWWCEGSSYNPTQKNRENRVEIVNSDPKLIKMFLDFLRTIKINENKLRVRLKCSEEEEEKLKRFWSYFLNIPMERFLKSILVKNYKGKKLEYGIATIRYNSRKLTSELQQRIDKMNKDIVISKSPSVH